MLHRPTFCEIDLAALTRNHDRIREILSDEQGIVPVVKADAYGHGAIACAKALEEHGANFFAVSLPEEGIELRSSGIRSSILVMGGCWPGQEQEIVDLGLIPAISDVETLDRLIATGSNLNVHLKIDTGMGRAGFRWDHTSAIAARLSDAGTINVTGTMTHFASAEDLAVRAATDRQIDRFNEAIGVLKDHGIDAGSIHLANSPGTVLHRDTHADLVRIGGGLYGLLDDILPDDRFAATLEQVMIVKSSVSLIKTLNAGDAIGYNGTFVADRSMRTATIPIGYADGLPRALSNKGHFLIGGQRARILGRISMDWTVVDLTELDNVSIGDEVIIFGRRDSGAMTACQIGEMCGTIGYEITCGISKRVPRVVVNG